MKNQKKQLETNAKVKTLALEKLRSTEGGRDKIIDLKDIGVAGGFGNVGGIRE